MRKPPSIFSNRRFRWMVILVAIVTLGFLAILVAGASLAIWLSMRKDRNNRVLWSGFVAGWVLWALAEVIWSVYATLGQEVPYPGIADLFWAVGYLPLGIGLIVRARSMPVKPNRRQNIFIVFLTALTVLTAFFLVILPTVREFDPQRVAESLLNLVYPLGDLFLLVVVWRLFFSYEEGDYGLAWILITLGFIFNTVADFVFTYSTWQGLYYPEMRATLLSRLGVDVPYTLSYLLWFTGIYALGILLKEETPAEPAARIRLVRTYGNILIYTRQDDTVMDVSANFEQFFGPGNVKGKPLARALEIPAETAQAILEKLHADGKVAEQPVQVRDRTGKFQGARLSGVAVFGPGRVFSGANLLLRMRIADAAFDAPLNEESRRMARFVLEKSGSHIQDEIGQFLADYYLAYLKSLLDMAFHQGGATAGQALLDQLQETSKKHNWQMHFHFETVLDSLDYPLDVLREALPVLLDTARQFVAEVTSQAAVDARMQKVRARFSETILRDVAYYEQAGHEVGFADHRKEPVKTR